MYSSSCSLQEAERDLSDVPLVSKLILWEETPTSYLDIDEEVVAKFREALLKSEVKSLSLKDLKLSSLLLEGFKGSAVEKLDFNGVSLTALPEEVNELISSLEDLDGLILQNLKDDVMCSKLCACFNNFPGELIIMNTMVRANAFATLFLSSRLTKISVSNNIEFSSDVEKQRFFGSLSFIKTLKAAHFNCEHFTYLFPSSALVKNERADLTREHRFKIDFKRVNPLITVQMPENLEELMFDCIEGQLSKPMYKRLAMAMQFTYLSVNVDEIYKPLALKFIAKISHVYENPTLDPRLLPIPRI